MDYKDFEPGIIEEIIELIEKDIVGEDTNEELTDINDPSWSYRQEHHIIRNRLKREQRAKLKSEKEPKRASKRKAEGS